MPIDCCTGKNGLGFFLASCNESRVRGFAGLVEDESLWQTLLCLKLIEKCHSCVEFVI